MPLPETQIDFWRLVFDQRLKCVVMLNEMDMSDTDEYQQSSSAPVNMRHYQLLNWPNKDVLPPDKASFLSVIEEVHRWQEQQKQYQDKNDKDKIIVHCSHVIQQINQNAEVDVFLAARYVSLRRQQFFQTQEEYKFLYDIALEYMSRYHKYVNFK
ncbi:hypothetical protein LSH36_1206g00025 [Paralvinella palmiformis]|uniref:Tyrosine-protein phosphatase domain-containing protein n=1 Tax=Paralvinella palmiformis TaxID=53620 RepID=A0AAD9IUF4_9ANNE|nr:hypothetical protein LSH36_1206g00025 [Paralvinella palmiformis]